MVKLNNNKINLLQKRQNRFYKEEEKKRTSESCNYDYYVWTFELL